MPSTYSNLKIQLMTTGENSGTWGDVTNTNLGTAIEEAIVGSVDVSFSNADVTLTLTNTNATQSARNLRLNLTGTVTTAQNLIVPAIEKVYIINNGLSQTITVKNSTGTGIAVPAGKTMWVYNDATNVVDVITHLTSLTLGTALPVASGGTGSNTATFSGANITSINASNISSGTIANARTTASSSNVASTIVARDASGNFSANIITANGSSLTAINASNISSGTLAVARGGTGAGTLTGLVVGNGTSAFTTVTAPSGTVVGTSDTQTLTNKTITQRVSSTTSITSPLAWNSDNFDLYEATAQAGNLTINADSGTPTDARKIIFRITSDATPRVITFTGGASKAFKPVGVTLTTSGSNFTYTLTASKTTYFGAIYDTSAARWEIVALSQET